MRSNELEGRGQPPLNFDVLRSICNNLTEVYDVLSFSLTCSSLRKGALQRRLGMSPVVLSSPESVERFHRFIFADPTSRAPFLYGLVLSLDDESDVIPEDGSSLQKHLIAILEAATRLEHLGFPTTVEYSVCSSVAKMTTLRELAVTSYTSSHDLLNPGALGILLTALRSPLWYLFVADYEQREISLSFLHNHLSHFAPTLESLTLGCLSSQIFSFSVTTPFTAMRSLHISSVFHVRFYPMDFLLHLFPNLDDTLSLNGFILPVHEYLTLREQSQDAQQEYTWRGLSRVTYSVPLAFTMALRCPIHRTAIYGPLTLDEARYLTEVLRDNCPQQLVLPIALFGHDHLQILDALFPPEAADRLTHLVLFFEADINSPRRPSGQCNNFSWPQFLDAFVHAMQRLRRLTHLRVVLYYTVYPPMSEAESNPSPTQSEPNAPPESPDSAIDAYAQNTAHDADLYPAAVRLRDTLPALEYVLLMTCGVHRSGQPWRQWHSSRAWQVQETASGSEDPRCGPPDDSETLGVARGSGHGPRTRSCVELSSAAAAAVVDEEELHLGQREETMVAHCVRLASE